MKNEKRWLAYGVTLCLLSLAQPSSADRTIGTKATTGYLSLTPGHAAIVTLAEVGAEHGVPVLVRLEILDGENQVLARSRGILRPGAPLSLTLRGDRVNGARLPVRARALVLDGGRGNPKRSEARPILSFELVSDTGDVNVGVLCPFPGGRGVEFDCGCIIDDLTLPE